MDGVLNLSRIRNGWIYGKKNSDEKATICSYTKNSFGEQKDAR